MGSWIWLILSYWVIVVALLSLPLQTVRAQASDFVLGFSTVDVLGGYGVRKLLQNDLSEKSSVSPMSNRREDEHSHRSVVTPLVVGVLLPGTFIGLCVVFCAWFHKRQQATAHTVLPKDMPSVDSSASFETTLAAEKAFSHEKYMGSPLRQLPGSPLHFAHGSPLRQPPGSPLHFAPGSPLRVPPSPLRVPPSPRFSMSPRLTRAGSIHLNFNQVVKFTHNFSPSLRIGKGGFGTVYKAQLEDGRVVAVKRAKREYFKGLRTEFSSEVELLAKIDHRNLVKLLGYVDHGDDRFIITEYVPNGTLREHLDGSHGRLLEFNQRLEIAIDVAHGLTYLHSYAERQIIHRDVKSSNILLTDGLRAKVADFGFARLGAADNGDTHVETNIKGTVGYLDPEYMRTYRLTTKSDVYSFGVLLTEMLTGRRAVEPKRPLEERVTVTWAFKKFDDGHVVELLDPRLEERVDTGILMRIFGLAMQCAAPVRADRSEMRSVGEQLWAIRADYLKTSRRA